MRVTLLPSSFGTPGRDQYLTTFLVNDSVAIDAGSLGLHGTPADQSKIRHIFLSHTHLDHIASLGFFLDNIINNWIKPVTIHAGEAVLDCLAKDIFNGRVWPDFLKISSEMPEPFVKLAKLNPYEPVVVEGLTIIPVPVDHNVPTMGFILDDSRATVVIAGDTGPTEAIWKVALKHPNLKAVYLEVSFPNAFDALAELTCHLTPARFGRETTKLHGGVRFLAVHMKASFAEIISDEMAKLHLDSIEICEPGRTYDFS